MANEVVHGTPVASNTLEYLIQSNDRNLATFVASDLLQRAPFLRAAYAQNASNGTQHKFEVETDEPGAAFRNVNVDKGISSNSMDGLSIYAEDGCIKTDGACDSMEVFDLTGKKVRNANLANGLYIVKATKGNDEMTVKVIVK